MSTAKETLQARLLQRYAAQLDALLAALTHRISCGNSPYSRMHPG
jgi:hypothetical protein